MSYCTYSTILVCNGVVCVCFINITTYASSDLLPHSVPPVKSTCGHRACGCVSADRAKGRFFLSLDMELAFIIMVYAQGSGSMSLGRVFISLN